jgi:hypothetical protein
VGVGEEKKKGIVLSREETSRKSPFRSLKLESERKEKQFFIKGDPLEPSFFK